MKEGWRKRVLVMDDDEGVRFFAGTALALLGYDVVLAREGDEAVEFFLIGIETGRPFGAVVLDLSVPNGRGALETLRDLRAIDPDVQAVISTGQVDHPAFQEFWKHGFCGAIEKPYRLRRLSETIAGLFEDQPLPFAAVSRVPALRCV